MASADGTSGDGTASARQAAARKQEEGDAAERGARRRAGGYRPPLREVPVHLLTGDGWVSGHIAVPAQRGLVDHLNRPDRFLKLNALSHEGGEPRFTALRPEAVWLVLPEERADAVRQPASPDWRRVRVRCRLATGFLDGVIPVRPGLRLSDVLQRLERFFALEAPRLALSEHPPLRESEQPLLLNAAQLLAVEELGEAPGEDAAGGEGEVGAD